jgi:hypothetical protein
MKKVDKVKRKKELQTTRAGFGATNATASSTLVKMGGCSVEYGRSLVNPFTGPSACVPTYPVSKTRKMRVFTRGTFSTSNTTGFGFVVADPQRGVCNDLNTVFASLASGVQANVDWTTAGNAAGANSNSDYAFAQLGEGNTQFNYKVVSCGLKIRYTGTELDRGGQLIGLQDQDHQSMYLRTLASIDGEETSRRFPVNRKWKRVLYRPLDSHDLDFQSAVYTYTAAPTDVNFYMAFICQAPDPAVSLVFEWEYFSNYEIIGRNVRGLTDSHVDPVGAAAAQAVVAVGTNLYPTELDSGELEGKMVHDMANYVHTKTTTFHQVPTAHYAGKVQPSSSKKKKKKSDDGDFWDDMADVFRVGAPIVGDLLSWLF